MTLCDTVRNFAPKITTEPRDTRYCSFAAPEETVGVIDLSPAGDGSRGIAFLTDRLLVKLGENVQQLYYSEIRVMEILPSYETPFEDELLLGAPSHELRISDCALNKFFLRQLISNISRISVTMEDADREDLYSQLTAEALDYYAGASDPVQPAQPEQPVKARREPLSEAIHEIAAAKKAALAQSRESIELTEEKIQWISGKHPEIPATQPEKSSVPVQELSPAPMEKATAPVLEKTPSLVPEKAASSVTERSLPMPEKQPATVPYIPEDEDITDMTHEQTMSYLLDSISEINSEPEQPQEVPEPPAPIPAPAAQPPEIPAQRPPQETVPPAPLGPPHPYTIEPDSPDIYIKASRRIRELCEEDKLTMEQVNAAVREQLVPASELFSTLDVENSPLPPAVKAHALRLSEAADRLPEYFRLGEDIAARVMFFMLYQMLSYADRIVQSDETKQTLNYFFVRFGAAGIILSMLDAEEG